MPYFYRTADSPHFSGARISPRGKVIYKSDFTPLTKKNLQLINNEHLRQIIEEYPSRLGINADVHLPTQALFSSLSKINDRTLAWVADYSKPCTFQHVSFVLKCFLRDEPAGSIVISPGFLTTDRKMHVGDGLFLFMTRMKETARLTSKGGIERSKVQFMGLIGMNLPSMFFVDEFRQALNVMYVPKLFNTSSGAKTEKKILMFPIVLG
jgi:hypothetical protein